MCQRVIIKRNLRQLEPFQRTGGIEHAGCHGLERPDEQPNAPAFEDYPSGFDFQHSGDKPMNELQAILREIVNDLEKTSAGLVVLDQKIGKRSGEQSLADVKDTFDLAKQGYAAFYNGIRKRIDALAAVPPVSGSRG